MSAFMEKYLIAIIAFLSVLILLSLLYALLGKRYTDKIVATNAISSLCIGIIVLLSVILDADYILDIAIVFAILSFLSIIVLCRVVQNHVLGKMRNVSAETAEADVSKEGRP